MNDWLDGETKLFKNVLSESLISRINQGYLMDSLRTNLTHWPPNIVNNSGPIFLYQLRKDIEEDVKSEVIKLLPDHTKDLKWSMTYTLGSRYSYLNWHNDIWHEYSITLYLNDHWEREYHGYLIYESPDGLRAVLPEYNSAFVFRAPLQHSTTMPTIQAPLRKSIQIFVSKIESEANK
jgi:Rps23 Pro-64 3,4-dihydroxylase Tpa1-like proline 4-hydroxylase